MAVITFMSDFGIKDHYVAAVKAAVIKINPGIRIIDISHTLPQSGIGQAAYLLKHVFKEFPPNTVHLCGIDSTGRESSRLVALKLEEHYFVGPDSGLFSLISEQRPTALVELNTINPVKSSFIVKDILAPVAASLAGGKDIHEMGKRLDAVKTLFSRQPKVTKKEIAGNVIHVDHYGNLITNINKKEFDTITQINGNKPFEILFGRERAIQMNAQFSEVDSGECFVLFNSDGNLQIGINHGNASELLGLNLDTPVNILFSES